MAPIYNGGYGAENPSMVTKVWNSGCGPVGNPGKNKSRPELRLKFKSSEYPL